MFTNAITVAGKFLVWIYKMAAQTQIPHQTLHILLKLYLRKTLVLCLVIFNVVLSFHQTSTIVFHELILLMLLRMGAT